MTLVLPFPMLGPAQTASSSAADLVRRARRGDNDAFRVIYVEHHPGVRRLLGDLLPAAAADDAAQETFVRAFTKMASLRDETRLRAWLLGIARLVAVEARRSFRRQWLADSPRLAPELLASPTPSPQDVSLLHESVSALHRALGMLKADRRMALLLRADHGLSYDEVADVMQWSVAKAKVEVHRGRLQLREWMDRRDGEGP